MKIYYENKKIEELIKNKNMFIRKYNLQIYEHYMEFELELGASNNLFDISL